MQGAVPKCGPARAGSYKDSRKDLHCSATTNAWFEFLDATRMGNDPRNSVVNAWHEAHDVEEPFCRGRKLFHHQRRGEPHFDHWRAGAALWRRDLGKSPRVAIARHGETEKEIL